MNAMHAEGSGMIVSRVEALGFRSLRYVSQRLGPFHVLVGPNASGKSTFLDVLAFLGDMQRVGLVQAATGNGLYGVPLRATDPQHLTWMRRGKVFELAVEAIIPRDLRERLRNASTTVCRYEIKVDISGPLRLAAETLWLKPNENSDAECQRSEFPNPPDPPERLIVEPEQRAPARWRKVISRGRDPERVIFHAETNRRTFRFHLQANKSALANLPEDEEIFPVAMQFRKMLDGGVQRIAPWSDAMHRPSSPAHSSAYFPDGSNLPQVVHMVEMESPDRYADWIKHIREALPDIDRITVIKRPEDGHSYLVVHYRNGLKAPSWLVSDGTLRFLALTLLAYLPNPTGPYLVEEPENGIHPQAVETILESLSSVYDAQMLLATHSPVVARLASVDQMLCFARSDERGVDIVVGSAHPRLGSWPSVVDLGMLLESGVLG